MGTPITGAELEELLAHGFRESAFRLEAQPSYAVGIEREALRQFAEGHPRPPAGFAWWQEWLDLIAEHASHGRTIGRVRVLAEPPTLYQRWLLWGDRWHAAAGERVSCLTGTQAAAIGLPVACDWWLFDGERAAVMRFGPGGDLAGTELVTGAAVRPYRQWRDLALRHATPAAAAA